MKLLKQIGQGMVYFLAGVGIVKTIDGGIYLMNQPDDTLFYAGLGVITLAGFFVITAIAYEFDQYQTKKESKSKSTKSTKNK